VDLLKIIFDEGFNIKKIIDIKQICKINYPYLYISNQKGEHYYSNVSLNLESQFFRKRIYRNIFINRIDDGWDWRKFTYEDLLRNTVDKIKNNI
ncbi:hypothetical protein JW964_05860, partial [candidate division KSB1 bacterium]|nr:hypothetical protein [candidate division KSB1 bacterium]